jgi:hypothetical protein
VEPFGHQNPIPPSLNMDDNRLQQITPQEAMIYLLFLASHFQRQALPIELLATTYVACAKQGQITTVFSEKMRQEVEDELGFDIDIDIDTIRILFQHFGKWFNETTAPIAFKHWKKMLHEHALRLRLIIEQVAFCRITVFKVIKEAMQTFPNFSWPLLNRLMPGEIPRFNIAVQLIQWNEYFGLKKNLGEASSTRYKYLGWVSKELLICGAGKGYQGWPRTVPNHDCVSRIIQDYLRDKGETEEIDEADVAVCVNLFQRLVV